jgi:hypothetical protein
LNDTTSPAPSEPATEPITEEKMKKFAEALAQRDELERRGDMPPNTAWTTGDEVIRKPPNCS